MTTQRRAARSASLQIRALTPADALSLAPLVLAFKGERAGLAGLASRIAACASVETALVAEQSDQLVGFACVQVLPAIADTVPHAALTELYVREQDRRRGIGRMLVAAAEAHARAHGAPELWLVTGFDNAQAQAFYRALGYADRALTMHRPLA